MYGEYISMVRRIQRDWRSGTERGNNFSVEGCVRCLVVRKKEVKMLRPLRLHKQGSTLGICAHFTNPFKAWPPDHHLFKCQDPKTLRIPPSGIPSRHYWPLKSLASETPARRATPTPEEYIISVLIIELLHLKIVAVLMATAENFTDNFLCPSICIAQIFLIETESSIISSMTSLSIATSFHDNIMVQADSRTTACMNLKTKKPFTNPNFNVHWKPKKLFHHCYHE